MGKTNVFLQENLISILVISTEGSNIIKLTGVPILQLKIQECHSYSFLRLSCYCPCAQLIVRIVAWVIRTTEISSISWNNNEENDTFRLNLILLECRLKYEYNISQNKKENNYIYETKSEIDTV